MAVMWCLLVSDKWFKMGCEKQVRLSIQKYLYSQLKEGGGINPG